MPKMKIEDMKEMSRKLFMDKASVDTLWQSIAEIFYPERADFTNQRNVGNELADDLLSSYTIIVRRDLGNSLAPMLRDGHWFDLGVQDKPTYAGVDWLQNRTNRLLRIMQHRSTGFTRSTKQADHDYVTFGQTVLSVSPNRDMNNLLYQNWHLRNCVWWDGDDGMVDGVIRRWRPSYRVAEQVFGDKLAAQIKQALNKPGNQFRNADFRHFFIKSDMYGDSRFERFKYVSVWIDVANDHLISEVGSNFRRYIVPRFQTVAGSAYAYSPATVAGLPDGRLLQAMTHTLMEAAERYARPPLVAQAGKVIRGDINLDPDGITYLDQEYDERLGGGLRPLYQDKGGFPIGLEMRDNVVEVLSRAFYLNKLDLPDKEHMTAYEVQQHMKMYRRENLPLFQPIESDYSGQLCELSFDWAQSMGLLGSEADIPSELRGAEVQFKFESPLSESEQEAKAQMFAQTAEMTARAYELDPEAKLNINVDEALRDAVMGIGAPNKWLSPPELVAHGRQAAAVQDAMQQVAAMQGQA